MTIMKISVGDIHPNNWNPNVMSEDEYARLTESIRLTEGRFLKDNPILVRSIDEGYEIVDGEHRWTVAVDLGYDEIWCDVREFSDQEAMELTVVLNKDRGQINYFKLSKLLNEFYEPYSHDLNQEQLGQRFGYKQPQIALIKPIYDNLKIIAVAILFQFSNYQLRLLASVRNDALRYLLVGYSAEKGTKGKALEKLVSNMNSITKYAVAEILKNEILKRELEKEGEIKPKELETSNLACTTLAEKLGSNVFRYSVKMMKDELDAIINDLGKTDLFTFTELGYPPTPWDVWKFIRDKKYGLEYPGSIPAGIVFNTLYFYTEQGDTIVDPMAGGGVVGDVCSVTKRECLMFDIQPCRDDITAHDLNDGFPAENADLIFLDAPYYKKNEKEYGENSISALDREPYLDFFVKLARDIYDSNAKTVAFLMSDYTDDDDPAKHIFIWDYVTRFEEQGWYVDRHIMAPLPEAAIHADFTTKFRESKKLGRLGRSLVIFRRKE